MSGSFGELAAGSLEGEWNMNTKVWLGVVLALDVDHIVTALTNKTL